MVGLSTDGIEVQHIADPSVSDSVLIEGLPGVGNVGKLAAEHLLEEATGTLTHRILSEHFPPQVSIDSSSTAALPAAEIHHVEIEEHDIFVLSGDHQAVTPMGHYRLTRAVLDVAEAFNTTRIFALGGMPTGEMSDTPAVVGAVSDTDLLPELESHGVSFREREPTGGIIGVSGLLLGLGAEREVDVACLMGETSGYLVDPRSAQAVLEILEQVIGFSIGYEKLEERADDMESMIRRLREMQEAEVPGGEDLRYIG